MSLPKSLLFNHSCMYAKRGGVAAYRIVWIGLCLRSVQGVRVLASATALPGYYYYCYYYYYVCVRPGCACSC